MHEHLILHHSSVSLPFSEFLEDLKAPPIPFPAHILALRCLQRFVFIFVNEESHPSCHLPVVVSQASLFTTSIFNSSDVSLFSSFP